MASITSAFDRYKFTASCGGAHLLLSLRCPSSQNNAPHSQKSNLNAESISSNPIPTASQLPFAINSLGKSQTKLAKRGPSGVDQCPEYRVIRKRGVALGKWECNSRRGWLDVVERTTLISRERKDVSFMHSLLGIFL
ncbi:hypothetical protein TNCV_3844381 [Trichonephila clavipes]|nr:hypothetical protein TNCV_3844381 [Trichonephila clavipes]